MYLTIVIVFCALFFLFPKKHIGWLFVALVIALSIMAYHAVPAETDDLRGYFNYLDRLREGGWPVFREMMKNDVNDFGSLPTCGYYFFLISRLPNNGFLPGVTIFLAYGSMFLVLNKAAKRFEISHWYLFVACFFLLATYYFYDICSGIRNGLGFTLFISIVYLELVENKNKWLCWAAYIILTGLHASMFLLLIIRLMLLFTNKRDGKIVGIVMAAAVMLSPLVFDFASRFDNSYLNILAEKGERNYDKMNKFATETFLMVNYPTFAIIALASLYCSSLIKNSQREYEQIKEYLKFYQFISMFTFGSMLSQLLFLRIVHWILPAMSVVLFMIGLQINSNKKFAERETTIKNSVIRCRSTLTNNEIIVNLAITGYSLIYLWYACNGSSLIWLHFK